MSAIACRVYTNSYSRSFNNRSPVSVSVYLINKQTQNLCCFMQQLIATVYNIKHNNTIIPNTDNDGTKEQYIIGCVRLRRCFQNKWNDRFCRVSAASGTSGKSGVNQGIQLILEIIVEVSRNCWSLFLQ